MDRTHKNDHMSRSVLLWSIRRVLGIHLPVKKNVYDGSRRESNTSTNKCRNGPAPLDDTSASSNIIRSLPGILDDTPEKAATIGRGMAGNQALLTYFHRMAQSVDASERIDFVFLLSLLDGGGDFSFTDRYGQTILHAIARDWHPDVAKFVLERGALIQKGDKYGRTTLHIASAVGHIDMIKFLVSQGANLNCRTYGEHQSPIHYAAKNDSIRSLKTLIGLGANVNDRDYKNRTPLFLAAELGRVDAAQYLLDLGVPAGVFDTSGNFCVSVMVEKMPSIAYQAMSQFFHVNKLTGVKKYFLNYMEFNPQERQQNDLVKTPLEVIVENDQMDLLLHPVIQRILEIKWELFGKKYVVSYFLVNIVYALAWTAMSIYMSYVGHSLIPFSRTWWRWICVIIVTVIGFGFFAEQIQLFKILKRKHSVWKEWRINDIKTDYKYCHPTWPEERRFLEIQVEHLQGTHSKYSKDPWNYFECLAILTALISFLTRVFFSILKTKAADDAMQIWMTFTIMIMWIRIMKACRGFKYTGQFIAFLGTILKAVLQFSLLFIDFFIPFCVAFWVLFGGEENAMKMKAARKVSGAYSNLNDLIYTVWTLTVVGGFPYSSLLVIDKYLAQILLGLYFTIISVICLSLWTALLSQVFGHVYRRAKEYATLEQAKVILLAEKLLNATTQQNEFLMKTCSPLVEAYSEKDDSHPDPKLLEISLGCLKRQTNNIVEIYKEHKKLSGSEERPARLKEIRNDIDKLQYRLRDWDTTLTALQKIEVENKKIMRRFVNRGNHDLKKTPRTGRKKNSDKGSVSFKQ